MYFIASSFSVDGGVLNKRRARERTPRPTVAGFSYLGRLKRWPNPKSAAERGNAHERLRAKGRGDQGPREAVPARPRGPARWITRIPRPYRRPRRFPTLAGRSFSLSEQLASPFVDAARIAVLLAGVVHGPSAALGPGDRSWLSRLG